MTRPAVPLEHVVVPLPHGLAAVYILRPKWTPPAEPPVTEPAAEETSPCPF